MQVVINASVQQKAIELNNYKFFDFNLIGVDGAFDDLVAYIYEKISSNSNIGRIKQANKNLEIILCNVYWVLQLDDKKYIAYSRGKNRYLKTSRYNKTGITFTIVKVIDALESNGYLETHLGFQTKKKSRRSRLIHTQKLRDVFLKFKIQVENIIHHQKTELIILRDKDGFEIEYEDGIKIIEHRSLLTAYNNLLASTTITLPNSNKPLYFVHIERIFNNSSWLEGGRFYGGIWQRENTAFRSKMKLNGNKVVEVDYSGLHIVLAYALIGIDYWKDLNTDPYEIEGYEGDELVRAFFKKVTLILINATDEKSALKAINQEVNYEDKGREPHKQKWNELHAKKLNFKDLIGQFKKKHPLLVEHKVLASNIGIMLQGLDSKIAEGVINRFVAINEPVLCVHDSFIVTKDNKKILKETMYQAFKEVMESIGVTINVSVKVK